jgi:dynein heavy chain 2
LVLKVCLLLSLLWIIFYTFPPHTLNGFFFFAVSTLFSVCFYAQRRSEALRTEEELKLQLSALEKQLLENLATSTGNILENTALLASLTETKTKSATIAEALSQSRETQRTLDIERDVFRPVASKAARMFFVIRDLQRMGGMYRFSLRQFLNVFGAALADPAGASGNANERIMLLPGLVARLAYGNVARALIKDHLLPFAAHTVRGVWDTSFGEGEWEAIVACGGPGVAVGATGKKGGASGNSVSSSSSGGLPLPDWAAGDRATAWAALQSNLPGLARQCRITDTAVAEEWRAWARVPDCEAHFPGVASAATHGQRVAITAALRPDRLPQALTQLCCAALGLESLAPPPLDLDALAAEAGRATPVMVIVTPGADPSQELADTAAAASVRCEQVAMGQGQAEAALEALRSCAREGGWCVLKNIHLVTGWLPVLEAELQELEAGVAAAEATERGDEAAASAATAAGTLAVHRDFRLWLTAEAHPGIPPVLLRSSLKVSFESPPGLKKNLARTYAAWTDEYLARGSPLRAGLHMALAWFHAIAQERRNYVPQGWLKAYEFSAADLKSAAGIIEGACASGGGGSVDWAAVRGLLANAVYGGVIDSEWDNRVLATYLRACFDPAVVAGKRKLGGVVAVPPGTTDRKAFVAALQSVPDADSPSVFGLSLNAERGVGAARARLVVKALASLAVDAAAAEGSLSKAEWSAKVVPFVKRWRTSLDATGSVKDSLLARGGGGGGGGGDGSPVASFVAIESASSREIIRLVAADIAAMAAVADSTALMSPRVARQSAQVILGHVPEEWYDKWEGPEGIGAWIDGVLKRCVCIERLRDRAARGSVLSEPVTLSELFNPATFLNALRQQTARERKCALGELGLRASFGSASGKGGVTLSGLGVVGARVEGGRLVEVRAN